MTLMLHTFVGHDVERVREAVEAPLRRYLSNSADLMRGSGPDAGRGPGSRLGSSGGPGRARGTGLRALLREGRHSSAHRAPAGSRWRRIEALGVDEVACLIDFGVDTDIVLASLPALDAVRQRCERDFRLRRTTKHRARAAPPARRYAPAMHALSGAGAAAWSPARRGARADWSGCWSAARRCPARAGRAAAGHRWAERCSTCTAPRRRPSGPPSHVVEVGPGPVSHRHAHRATRRCTSWTRELRPSPVGVPGELYIGGTGVARGYHAPAGADRRALPPGPDVRDAGARMYRTGDRARWRADGTVEFLGRVDHQLKVRGFRVEPGEIEAVLARHPDVRAGRGRGARGACSEPRGWWRTSCPGRDTALRWRRCGPSRGAPAGAHGALGIRGARRAPADAQRQGGPEGAARARGREPCHVAREYVAPRTETERRVAELWSSLLGVPRVGAEDDFFALGGHSLLATRAASRIRESFGVDLPLRELFEASTPAALAARLEPRSRAWRPGCRRSSRVPARARCRCPSRSSGCGSWSSSSPVAPPTTRRWSCAWTGRSTWRCWSAPERGRPAARVLRATFRDEDGTAVQRIHPDVRLALARVDLTTLPGASRPAEARAAGGGGVAAVVRPRVGPAAARDVFHAGARASTCCCSCCTTSCRTAGRCGVLVREVAALYRAFSAGRESPLPEPAVQYVDFALVAARVAARGRAGVAARVLAGAAGRCASGPGTAHGPAAPRRAQQPGRESEHPAGPPRCRAR